MYKYIGVHHCCQDIFFPPSPGLHLYVPYHLSFLLTGANISYFVLLRYCVTACTVRIFFLLRSENPISARRKARPLHFFFYKKKKLRLAWIQGSDFFF